MLFTPCGAACDIFGVDFSQVFIGRTKKRRCKTRTVHIAFHCGSFIKGSTENFVKS